MPYTSHAARLFIHSFPQNFFARFRPEAVTGCSHPHRKRPRGSARYASAAPVSYTHLEALNREKILRGLVKACEKRPVSMDRLDRAVEMCIRDR